MNVNALTELSLISYSLILIGLSLASAILSLAGIPPFAGFFGKFMIMQSLLEVSYNLLTLSSLFMTIAIPTYYIRIIRFTLFKDSGKKEPIQSFLRIPFSHHVIMITMFITNIGFLFYQPKFLYLIQVVCDYLLLTC
jgi:NADH-quinone oxidoreductase subunit N